MQSRSALRSRRSLVGKMSFSMIASIASSEIGFTRCSQKPAARERCSKDVPALREVAPGHWSACHYAEELA